MKKESELAVIKAEIEEELRHLSKISEMVKTTLNKKAKEEPDEVTKIAMGGLLHSFYNGIERIMLKIVKSFEKEVPTGPGWHVDLLKRARIGISNIRPALWTPSMADVLIDYMGFRHIFRSSYGFELKLDKMLPLLTNVENTLWKLRQEIDIFFNRIL